MRNIFPGVIASALTSFTVLGSTSALADVVQLRCAYTEVTYEAPFIEPSQRQCPEQRCSYDLSWDVATGEAFVDGLVYQLAADAERVLLTRETPNPVMGGVDKATFSVTPDSLEFRAIRHTSPEVKLSLQGLCVAF